MKHLKDLYKSLPDPTNKFEIDVQGELTAIDFKGEFACKIPNGKDRTAVGKHKAYLNGGFEEGLDLATKNFNHMISYLRYTLTEFPVWWTESDLGYALYDVNVVEEVYNKVLANEEAWLKTAWKDKTPVEKKVDEDAPKREA